MKRTKEETLKDLEIMQAKLVRIREVIFAKAFFQSEYDDALARVAADLGPCMRALKLILPTDSPEALIDAIRDFLDGDSKGSDVPLTLPLGGPW